MRKYFTLAPMFKDNMIFQANKVIRLYGSCKKNIEISVKFLNQEQKIKTTSDHFLVELKAENYCDKPFSFTLTYKKQVEVFYNVLIGDVFLYLGGPNMKQAVKDSVQSECYINNNLRFYDITGKNIWLESAKDSLEDISVLAYLSAKFLHEQIKHPLAIVILSKDDENIFSWSNKSMVLLDKEIGNYLNGTSRSKDYHLSREYSQLKESVFNFSFKALVLYQGENDFYHYHFYEKTLRLFIKSCRVDFKDLYLPFYIIQMAGFEYKHASSNVLSDIRIAQSNLASEKDKIYLVSVIDVNEKEMVSLNKSLLSKRLANTILEKQYNIGKNTLCPQVFSYKHNACQVNITVHNNFLALVSRSGQKLGFYYSNNTIDFYPIKDITVNNHQISMKLCEGVKEIRYAYKDNPTCDIYTSNGLPLLPFKITL